MRSAPPRTGSPGPCAGPEPQKSPERVRKEYPCGGAPKVPKECAPESQKSPKRVRKSGFRLFSDSFETPGRTLSGLLGPCPGVLFPDSFRTLAGFSGPKGPGDPVWGGADGNPKGPAGFRPLRSTPRAAVAKYCLKGASALSTC